jgi:C4-dicarboxylate transporter DctM subunit
MSAAIFIVLGLLVLLFLGLHVASAIILLAFGSDALLLNGMLPLSASSIAWDRMNEFALVAIPLFVLLGEILLRAGIAEKLYNSLAAWLEPLPGGLLHTNTFASALFAATSGSSVATAATIGTVAIPLMEKRGYDNRMVYGSLAAGGTLGVLIPPSILMIVYGALADVSVGKLFMGGVIPGIILAVCMSLTIICLSLFKKLKFERGEQLTLGKKISLLVEIIPILIIFIIVIGSIYAGLATPTESAALGIVAAILLAAYQRTLSISMLHQAFLGAMKTTSMIILIIVAAFCLNFVLALLGIPQAGSRFITELGLSPYAMIWLLVVFYVILGCFLEAVSMMVTTVGVVVPIIVAAGFDPLWFGIFLTVLMEISMITPPVGLNLYVVQSLRPPGSNIFDVFIGIIPFIFTFIVVLAILIYFPDIVLWLPSTLK